MSRIRAFFLTVGIGGLAGSLMMLLSRLEPVDNRFQDFFKWLSSIGFLAGLVLILIFTNKLRKINLIGAGIFGLGLLAVYLGTTYGGQSVGSTGWVIGLIMITLVFPTSLIIFAVPGLVSLALAVKEQPGARSGFGVGLGVLALLAAIVVGIMVTGPDMDQLTADLSSQDQETRQKAIHRLGSIDNYLATEALEGLLSDPDPLTRAQVILALGRSPRNFMVIKALTRAVGDESPEVRLVAIQSLCLAIKRKKGRRYKDTVNELLERLHDQDERVRSAAAEALGWMGDSRAIDPLIESLEDDAARYQAKNALMILTDQDLGDDPAEWRDWRRRNK